MNGQWLGSRSIRTNWATRKPPAPYSSGDGGRAHNPSNGGGPPNSINKSPTSGGSGMIKPLNYEEMFRQASASNFTVYCGGVTECDENTLRRAFSTYGRILEIRFFRDKGYAFVRFDNKESACSAIVAVHGTQIAGQIAKCSWGKENPNGIAPAPTMTNAMSGADYYRGAVPAQGMPGEAVVPDQLMYYQQQQQQQYYANAYVYPQQYMQYYAQYGGGGYAGYGGPQQAPPPPPGH